MGKGYHITFQTIPTYTDIPIPGPYPSGEKDVSEYKLSTIGNVMRVSENYDLVWCINWSAKYPVHQNFWDPNLEDWEIQRIEINSPEDLKPYLQSYDGVNLSSPYELEEIYDKLKQGFYFINKYPEELGAYYNLNSIEEYNSIMSIYIGELTSHPRMFNDNLEHFGFENGDMKKLDRFKAVISKHQDEWTDDVKDSVELIVYHNSKDRLPSGVVGAGSLTYQNVISGKYYPPIEIEKVDENGNSLEGAEFKLIGDDGSIRTWISDNQSKKLYLKPGNYTLEEVRAPQGRMPIDPYSFTIVKEKDIERSIEKEDIPLLKDSNFGGTNTFKNGHLIFNNKEALIRETNKSFEENSNKFAGGNLIVEKKYAKESKESPMVKMSENGLKIDVENESPNPEKIYGEVILKKVDKDGNPLEGAEFILDGKSKDGEKVTIERTSFKDGELIFSSLPEGEYIIREIKAPIGYEKLNYQFKVIINEYGVSNVIEEPLSDLNTSNNFIDSIRENIINQFTNSSNVDEKIEILEYRLKGKNIPGLDNTIYASSFEPISMMVSMKLKDKSVKKGDRFTIKLDKKLQPLGIIPSIGEDSLNKFYPPAIIKDNDIIATGEYDNGNNQIIYTFTDYVENSENILMNLEIDSIGPNRKLVTENGNYKFINNIAGKNQERDLIIDYKIKNINTRESIYKIGNNKNPEYMNSKESISSWNRDIGGLKFVTYLNPDGKNGPDKNTRFTISVIEGINNADIKIYKVPKDDIEKYMVDSMDPNINELNEIKKEIYKDRNKAYINFTSSDFNGNGYIVITNLAFKSTSKDININTNWQTLKSDGKVNNDGISIENNTQLKVTQNSFTSGDRIYIDKFVTNLKDVYGKFKINKEDQDGLPINDAEFTLTKNDDESFKIVKRSDENGLVEFSRLKEGIYILKESSAPNGYQKIDKSWQVRVDKDGITTVIENDNESIKPFNLLMKETGQDSNSLASYTNDSIETGKYGDLIIKREVKELSDDKYSISMGIELPKAEKLTGKKDVIFFIPQFDAMNEIGMENYRQAVLDSLKDLKKIDNNSGNIKVGFVGYSNEKSTNDFKSISNRSNGILDIDQAINHVEGNIEFFVKNNVKDDKGIIPAIQYVLNSWLLAGIGNSNGARNDAQKIFVIGAGDIYWKEANIGGFTENDFKAMTNGDYDKYIDGLDELKYRYPNVDGPMIRNVLIAGHEPSWKTYLTNRYPGSQTISLNASNYDGNKIVNREVSIDEFKSAMNFYGMSSEEINNVPLKISFNDIFDLSKGVSFPIDPIDSSNEGIKDFQIYSNKTSLDDKNNVGWHEGYDESKKEIILKKDELRLKAGNRANINFTVEIHDKKDIERDKPIPLINDITLDYEGKIYTIPAPTVEIPKSRMFNVDVDFGNLDFNEDIKLEFSNGEIKILNNANHYSLSLVEEDMPLDTTISKVTIPDSYLYEIVGEKANYKIKIFKNPKYVPSITVENKKIDKGKFTITKLDEYNNKLANAKFELLKDGKVYLTGVSDSEGKIIFDQLDEGKYILRENEAPEGYEKINETWTVIVDPNGVTNVSKNLLDTNSIREFREESKVFAPLKFFTMRQKQIEKNINEEISKKVLEPSTYSNKVEDSKIVLSAEENIDNNKKGDFTIKLDIVSGNDKGESIVPTDIVIIIPKYKGMKTQGFEQYKETLLEWLKPYREVSDLNTNRVGVISYINNNSIDKTVSLLSPKEAYDFLKNISPTDISSTTGGEKAFEKAVSMLNGVNSRKDSNKIIINGSTNANVIGLSEIINNIEKESNAKLSIYNFNLGNSSNNVLANTNKYQDAFVKAENIDNIFNFNFYSKEINGIPIPRTKDEYLSKFEELKISQAAIDNGEIIIPFNNDFYYVDESLESKKTNPENIMEWVENSTWAIFDKNENAIKLNENELSLKAGQKAHLEFNLSFNKNVKKDEGIYLLGNDNEKIIFKAREDVDGINIDTPKAIIYDKESITIRSDHSGEIPVGGIITAKLVRNIEGGLDNEVKDINFPIGNDGIIVSEPYRVKNDNGNLYNYKLIDIKVPKSVVLDTIEPILIGNISENSEITIKSHFDDNKMALEIVDIHDGNNTGEISAILRRKVDENIDEEFQRNISLNINEGIKIPDLEIHDLNNQEYIYYLENISTPENILITKEIFNIDKLEITSRDIRGFEVTSNWNGLKAVGEINVLLDNGEEIILNKDKLFHTIEGLEAENIKVVEIEGSEDNYDYSLFGEKSPYVIEIRKKENIEFPNIEVVNKRVKGKFTIKKTDESGEKLIKGAEFSLKNDKEEIIQKVVTDEMGLGEFIDLLPGEYILEETLVPVGYERPNKTWIVNVLNNGKVILKERSDEINEIVNEIGREIIKDRNGLEIIEVIQKIEKIEENKYKFNLSFEKGKDANLISDDYPIKLRWLIDRNNSDYSIIGTGEAAPDEEVRLSGGTLQYLPEIVYAYEIEVTNNDYVGVIKPFDSFIVALNGQEFDVNVSSVKREEAISLEENKGGNFNIINISKKGHFQIIKTNEEGKVLEGATFVLKEGDKVINEVTSKEDGILVFNNLKEGDYTLEEMKAPESYERTDNIWYVHVDMDGNTRVKVKEKGDVKLDIVNTIYNSPSKKIYGYNGNYGRIDVVRFDQVIEDVNNNDNKNNVYKLKINYDRLYNSYYDYIYPLNIQFDKDNFDVFYEGKNISEKGYNENFNSSVNISPRIGSIEFELKIKNSDFLDTRTLKPIKSFSYGGTPLTDLSYFATIEQKKIINEAPDKELDVDLKGDSNEFNVINKLRTTNFGLNKRDGLALDKPLEDVEFTLSQIDDENKLVENGLYFIKSTDASGNLQFIDIPDGRYKLEETRKNDDYYDILIDFIIVIKDGEVSYTRKLKDTEVNPAEAKATYINELKYDVQFLPKDKKPTSYKVELYRVKPGDDELVKSFENINNGLFKNLNSNNGYYIKLNLNGEEKGWELSYIKTGNNSIQVIAYKKGEFENLGENEFIQIRNFPEQKGEGKFTIVKKDSKDNSLLETVEFNVKGSNGYNKNFSTNKEGKIIVENLPNGVYTITEVSAPDGYILDKTPRQIIIGGDFEVPIVENPKDVTELVDFAGDTILHVSNPEGEKTDPKKIDPNSSEAFNITSSYKFKPGIKPGDYFYLDISENINPMGIYINEIDEFSLAGPMGLLAVGEFVKNENGHYGIKYTFTNYLNNQYAERATALVSYFIEPTKVTDNGVIDVYTKIGNNEDNYKGHQLDVLYNPTSYKGFNGYKGYTNSANSSSRLVEVDWDNNSYKEIIYVNRYQNQLDYGKLEFGHDSKNGGSTSNLIISENDSVKVYKVKNNVDVEEAMPKSYGLDYNNLIDETDYYKNNNRINIYKNLQNTNNDKWVIDFKSDMKDKDSYVVVINGHFKEAGRTSKIWFRQTLNVYSNNYLISSSTNATFNDPYENKVESDGKMTINVLNSRNRIEYTKMGGRLEAFVPSVGNEEKKEKDIKINDQVLSGAKFQLKKKEGEDFIDIGEIKESNEYGKFFWEKLSTGEYQVWEIEAPKGYIKPESYVSSFKVSDSGEIIDIENNSLIIINQRKANLEIIKKDFNDEKELEGAKFSLYKQISEFDKDIKFDENDSSNFEKQIIDGKSEWTTDIDGKISFVNIEDGIYYIKENKAPDGYANLSMVIGPIVIVNGEVIEKTQSPTKENDKYTITSKVGENDNTVTNIITVYNIKVNYPGTGGFGIRIFTLLGIFIMAVGLLYDKKRRKKF